MGMLPSMPRQDTDKNQSRYSAEKFSSVLS